LIAAIEGSDAIEQSTRRTLARGGGLLVLGLAVVGVGAPAEGGPIALAGLLGTIYAIHRFGRLGPDDALPEVPAASYTSHAAIDAMWLGGLALLAGVSFVAGGSDGPGAYAALIGGGVAFAWGFRARGEAAKGPAAPANAAHTDEADAVALPDGKRKPRPARRRRPTPKY